MMLARRSRGARDTSLPIRLDISLVCRCIPLTSKIETALFLSSAQFARSIPVYATPSLKAPMRATSSRTPCPNSEPGLWKSSNDPIPRKASRFCRVDGLSRERSHGSTDAAGSPRTSRPPSQARLPGSSSPISAALRGGSQGLESNQVFMSRTLSWTLANFRASETAISRAFRMLPRIFLRFWARPGPIKYPCAPRILGHFAHLPVRKLAKVQLSLSLAYSGGVSECIFHSVPDMVRNFYTVSALPGHERNLMVTDLAAHSRDGVAEG